MPLSQLPIEWVRSWLEKDVVKLCACFSYPTTGYDTRIIYYSSSSATVRFNSIATGNIENDNQALLLEKRFLMSAVGNEQTACPAATPVGKSRAPIL